MRVKEMGRIPSLSLLLMLLLRQPGIWLAFWFASTQAGSYGTSHQTAFLLLGTALITCGVRHLIAEGNYSISQCCSALEAILETSIYIFFHKSINKN